MSSDPSAAVCLECIHPFVGGCACWNLVLLFGFFPPYIHAAKFQGLYFYFPEGFFFYSCQQTFSVSFLSDGFVSGVVCLYMYHFKLLEVLGIVLLQQK